MVVIIRGVLSKNGKFGLLEASRVGQQATKRLNNLGGLVSHVSEMN